MKGAVAVLAVVIFLSCMYFRFTNIFITYESPIQAYDDENFGRYSAIAVLEGEKTAFVGDIEGHNAIYIRTNNGISDRWKLTRYDKMKIQNKYIDGIFFTIFYYDGTDDYYLDITETAFAEQHITSISDSRGSEFKIANGGAEFFAYINSFDDEYRVFVNGKEINLNSLYDVLGHHA